MTEERDRISDAMREWEQEEGKRFLRSLKRKTHIPAAPKEGKSFKVSRVAMSVRQQHHKALTMLKTNSVYGASWGKSLDDILNEIDEVKDYIIANWKAKEEK